MFYSIVVVVVVVVVVIVMFIIIKIKKLISALIFPESSHFGHLA